MPKRRVEVTQFRSRAEIEATLIVSGCEPGVAILHDYLPQCQPPIEVAAIPAPARTRSRRRLTALPTLPECICAIPSPAVTT